MPSAVEPIEKREPSVEDAGIVEAASPEEPVAIVIEEFAQEAETSLLAVFEFDDEVEDVEEPDVSAMGTSPASAPFSVEPVEAGESESTPASPGEAVAVGVGVTVGVTVG